MNEAVLCVFIRRYEFVVSRRGRDVCVYTPLCVFVFVSRRGHDVLRNQLPDKEEHVILVRLGPLQRALYTEFMQRFRDAGNSGWLGLNPLKAFCVCCKVSPALRKPLSPPPPLLH